MGNIIILLTVIFSLQQCIENGRLNKYKKHNIITMEKDNMDYKKWEDIISKLVKNSKPYSEDNSTVNKEILWKEFSKILDITDEDLKNKDENWIKGKIRQLKIKNL